MKIYDDIIYVGANSHDVDLFEGQYIVPNGMAYNSYLIVDQKVAVLDTIDIALGDTWLDNIKKELNGRAVDYLIVSHMEPDHSANILKLIAEYPELTIVGNSKTFVFIQNFFGDLAFNKKEVKDGEILSLGTHELKFVFAPMIHWPEVMVTYDITTKTLFSADAFGKFGATDVDEDWACEARRYYFNIVGKYGAQVQALFKKIAGVEIETICPLHGPVLNENLGYYLDLYNTWSAYKAEVDGVFIAYGSIYGNTKKVAEKLYEMLKADGRRVSISDLARSDLAENVEDAFKYSTLVLCSPTQDGGIFSIVHEFLAHLKSKNFQNRNVAIIENGTWAPMSGKLLIEHFEKEKDIRIIGEKLTIKSAPNDSTYSALAILKDEIAKATYAD